MSGIVLVWAAGCMGISFWPPFEDAFKLPQFSLCAILPALALAAGGAFRPSALGVSALALVCGHLVSFAAGESARITDLLWFSSLAAAAPLIAEAVRRGGGNLSGKLVGALCAAGAVSALYCIVQFAGIDFGSHAGQAGSRPFSTMGNPDFLAAYLVAVLPAALLAWLGGGRGFWGLAAALAGFGIVLTQSRGAWLGMAAAVAAGAAILVLNRDRFRAGRGRLLVALSFGAVLAGFLILYGPARGRLLGIADAAHFDARGRIAMWRISLEMIRGAAVTGRGIGSYGEAYPAFHARRQKKEPSLPYFYTENAHNDYLQLAAEEGMIVLGIWIWIWVLYLRVAWMNVRKGDRLSLGMLLGFVAMQVDALFNFPWYLIPVQGWFWLTFAVLWARREPAGPPAGNARALRRAAWGAVAVAALVMIARDFRSNVLLKVSGDALAQSRWAESLRAADLSLAGWSFWENKARAANNGSVAAYGLGDLSASEDLARISAELNPNMPFAWGQLGLLKARRGDLDGAREALARALSLHPRHPESFHVLGNIAVLEKDWEAAERYWSAALREKPGLTGVKESLDSLRRAARR